MFKTTYLAVLVMSLSLVALGQLEDDENGWIDPGDMFNYDSGAKKMVKTTINNQPGKQRVKETCEKCDCAESDKMSMENVQKLHTDLSKCLKEKKELTDETEHQDGYDCQGGNEGLFFRQYIRSLLASYPSEGSYETQVTLTAADLATLQKFSTEEGRVEDAHHVLVNMADHVIPLENPVYPSVRQKLEIFLGIDLASLFMVLGAIMMCSITFSVLVRIHVPWSQILRKLFLALFGMSIPWNWWYLYKKAVAVRHADLLKDVPPECNPKDQSATQSLFQWVVSSFTFSTDACAEYHEKMLVDPIWEVPPTQALAVTATKFFLEPLKHIGVYVKLMIRGLLEDMPIHMWPVVIFLFVFLTIFILLLVCGYRIGFLWNIFRLEPGHPAPQSVQQPLPQAPPPQSIQFVMQGTGGIPTLQHQPENISYQGAVQNRPAIEGANQASTSQPGSTSYTPPVPSTGAPVIAATALHTDTLDGDMVPGRGAQPRPPIISHTSHPTIPSEPHTSQSTVSAKAHTTVSTVTRTSETQGILTQPRSAERGDGSHSEGFSVETSQDTGVNKCSSGQIQKRVSQEAVSEQAGQGHGGGMGDDPSVKSEGQFTQKDGTNGTNIGGIPALTVGAEATAPSTQLETEDDLGSFELLTHDGQSGEPVDIQPTVEEVGATEHCS